MQAAAFIAVLFACFVAALAWILVSNADGWADWVVFAVIVLTAVGAAIAIYPRRYPTRKRTFIHHSDETRR